MYVNKERHVAHTQLEAEFTAACLSKVLLYSENITNEVLKYVTPFYSDAVHLESNALALG
jgi:hypothetical protein